MTVPASEEGLSSEQLMSQPSSSSKKIRAFKPLSRREAFIAPLLALFVVIAFSFAIYHEFNPNRTASAGLSMPDVERYAQVVSVVEPVFAGDTLPLKKGQLLAEGDIHLVSGRIELEFTNKVRAVLEGPLCFNIKSAMKTFCQHGRVSVEVPPGATGFEVRTPFMNVRDLSTAFVVDVSENKSDVHVIQGSVEVHSLAGAWQAIEEGVAMTTQRGGTVSQASVRKDYYVSRQQMLQASNRFEEICGQYWSRQRDFWANDPQKMIYLDFDSDTKDGIRSETGIRKVPGRRAGLNAVEFRNRQNVMGLDIKGGCKSFTMMAVVKLNDLSNVTNVIFASGATGQGAIHWQISQRGEIQLLLGADDLAGLQRISTGPVLDQATAKTWGCLAVTFDAETQHVTIYKDGRILTSQPCQLTTPFDDFSHAELGNWQAKERTPTSKNFNGRIDEFCMIGRAVSTEEIRANTSFYPETFSHAAQTPAKTPL